MKIVVCVKQVPDTAATVVVENGKVSWTGAELVLNPWDEYAVEAALQTREQTDGHVIAVSLAQEGANEALKQALAMGCDEAVLIADQNVPQLDAQATARILAAAITKIGAVDLAFFGKQAIDGDTALTPVQIARLLDWPVLTLISTISELDQAGQKIRIERSVEEGKQIVEASYPAIISVIKDFGEPRYPSFMGIRKAARAEIPAWAIGDLDIAVPESHASWPEVFNRPKREVVCEFISGDGPKEIAEKLAEKIIAEKIL